MTAPRVLVAGIGNVFLGDDGFGVAVAQRLATRTLPPGVVVMDAGIRGLDLTYALMDGYDLTILIDATQRGGKPGTLYVIDPDEETPPGSAPEPTLLDAHGMDPVRVLAFARASGVTVGTLRVVGCDIQACDDDMPEIGLSAPVDAAIPVAIELVESLLAEFAAEPQGESFRNHGVHRHA